MLCASLAIHADGDNKYKLKKENVTVNQVGDKLMVSMDLVLDSTRLSKNNQLFVTPVIQTADGTKSVVMPSVLFSGRNMHYIYLRNEKKALPDLNYEISKEVRHKSDKPSIVSYVQSTELRDWMKGNNTILRLVVDTCGCRNIKSKGTEDYPLNLNPAERMLIMAYPRPVAEKPRIINHHGKARVQFQVDRFELHDDVYTYVHKVTKRKHTIDNRKELKTICDSIEYATSNPNVVIAGVQICGYASPESPYDHNDYLATNRSRVLSEWIAKRYHLADSVCSFSSVPENWQGFRAQTLAAKDITEQQRKDLLELIDRKAYGSADWDQKETELKTSPKFAQLYATKIHPDWFPELRYTDFNIQTQLRPMTNEQLHQLIRTSPELMSLNQIYTVASECEHGSKEFRYAMQQAIKYYSEDEVANAVAAAMAIEEKDYSKAAEYLKKAGDTDDANILRGIVETYEGNIDAARAYFTKAIKQPEAQRNLNLIK